MKLRFRVLNGGRTTHVMDNKISRYRFTLCGKLATPETSKPAEKAGPTSFLVDLDRQEQGEQLTIWKLPLCKKCEHNSQIWRDARTGRKFVFEKVGRR